MDSLESRIKRLSPDQRRSVEDYIDFLLNRSSQQATAGIAGTGSAPPPAIAAPPPLIFVPEIPSQEFPVVRPAPAPPRSEPAPAPDEPDPATLLIQEIASEKDDILTAGYMDYGTFEPAKELPPSPADEAVKRVKARMSQKKDVDPVQNVLDWID